MSLTKATYSMIDGSPANVLDYGASPSANAAVNTAAFQAALDTNKSVYVPSGTYNINTISINGQNQLFGDGHSSKLVYGGTDEALLFDGTFFGIVENLWIDLTDPSGTGVHLYGPCRYCVLNYLHITGTGDFSNTGKGIFVEGTSTPFLGFLTVRKCNVFYHKYAVYLTGDVTSTFFYDCALLGYPVAPLITGSKGFAIVYDGVTNTSNVGGVFIGGYVEHFETAFDIANRGGVKVSTMVEANTSNLVTGEVFNGTIDFGQYLTGFYARESLNTSPVTRLYTEQRKDGNWIMESYNPQQFGFNYLDGNAKSWGLWTTSDGTGLTESTGFPMFKGGVLTDGNGVTRNSERDRLASGNLTVSWDNNVPTTGNWQLGSIVFNYNVGSGNAMGWICNSPGSFGAALSTTGSISVGTHTLTVANSTGFVVGDYIDIGTLPFAIVRKISGNVMSVTFGVLNTAAASTQSSVSVARRTPPTFLPLVNIP